MTELNLSALAGHALLDGTVVTVRADVSGEPLTLEVTLTGDHAVDSRRIADLGAALHQMAALKAAPAP